ncbi:MAG: signal peptidase I [Firmicutes bacterium]|nr:signal peptidase I [Bacillota bacterium]
MLTRISGRRAAGGEFRRALILISIIGLIYSLQNFRPGWVPEGFWGSYGLPALLWGGLALVVLRSPPRRAAAKRKLRNFFRWLALICALAGAGAAYAAGLLEGFGKSPYDLSGTGILVNICYLGAMVAGMELSRAWFLNTFFRRRPAAGIVLTAVGFTFFWFTASRMAGISGGLEAAKFIGGTFLPALSENVLASYLAFWGGALPAAIYRGVLLASRWFLPVLPDLGWITEALVGTFAPAFGLVLTHQLFLEESPGARKYRGTGENPFGWIATSAICVLIIWFSVGVFSYFPSAIVSGSMSPQIEMGDVVIVKREPDAGIKTGDIILFAEEQMRITHRVVEIGADEAGGPLYWTKGDANKNRDAAPVLPEQVVGTIVYTIPKAGWVAIWTRSRSS